MSVFTSELPRLPGSYEVRCEETDNEPSVVIIRGNGRGLDVVDDDIGTYPLEDYAANLTNVTWRKIR